MNFDRPSKKLLILIKKKKKLLITSHKVYVVIKYEYNSPDSFTSSMANKFSPSKHSARWWEKISLNIKFKTGERRKHSNVKLLIRSLKYVAVLIWLDLKSENTSLPCHLDEVDMCRTWKMYCRPLDPASMGTAIMPPPKSKELAKNSDGSELLLISFTIWFTNMLLQNTPLDLCQLWLPQPRNLSKRTPLDQ